MTMQTASIRIIPMALAVLASSNCNDLGLALEGPEPGEWIQGGIDDNSSVPAAACPRGRNAAADSLERTVNACVFERNGMTATIDWHFTAKDARRKLHRLYPCHS
jgi:hypothetical protein